MTSPAAFSAGDVIIRYLGFEASIWAGWALDAVKKGVLSRIFRTFEFG
jgi:hypothetical protein